MPTACADIPKRRTKKVICALFFNKVKAGTYSSIKRCFITGVSPVTMDDLTSGFNIGTNYSLSSKFNQMMGFTEAEVREMLAYYSTKISFNHTIDELIGLMKPWYDNYCFAQECYGETTLYNSNMVLYFVKNYIAVSYTHLDVYKRQY